MRLLNGKKPHANDLSRLVVLVKEIIRVVRENKGNAVLKYDGRSESLEVWTREGSRMLPDDLYLKLGDDLQTGHENSGAVSL